MQSILLPARNRLACPASRVTAGFDPSHVAAKQADFSAFATGAGFINLLQGGRVGVNSISLATTINGIIGAGTKYTGIGDNTKFSGYSATRPGFSTIAAILQFNTIGTGFAQLFADNSNAKGNALNVTAAGLLQWTMFGVVAESSGITLVINTPYFVVASQNAAVGINYVVTNMATGKLTTSTSASQNPSQSTLDGNYTISPNFNSLSVRAAVAAVMHSTAYLPMSELVAWAAAPWSFWYPLRARDAIARAGFPWWATRNNNMPVIGAGTY